MKVGSPSIPSNLRPSLTLIIVSMIISSPFLLFLDPVLVLARGSNIDIDTSSQHAAFSLEDTSSSAPLMSSSAPSTNVSPMDSDFTTQAPLQIPRTLQSNDLVNSLAFYEVTFITSTTGAIDKIRMDFPTDTNIAPAGVIERVGIGGGTLLKSGSSLTYDVTTPVSIPAGTFIRLEMFGIKNPTLPGNALTTTITTRDSGGNLIDGPSATNVYKIRRIGTNDLAVNAVTSQKLADGSVTSTKPAESFMKRVVVADNAAGNAVGWNPDGVADDFQITEPAVVGSDSHVSVSVEAFGSPSCHAWPMEEGIFNMQCDVAPMDSLTLSYVVETLPAHIIA